MRAICSALVLLATASAALAQGAWSDPAGVPEAAGSGASIVAAGVDTLYVSPGNNSTGFYKHTISTGAWEAMPRVPAPATEGSSMAFRPGTTFLYLLCGERKFYRYDLSMEGTATSPWTALAYPTTVPRATSGAKLVATPTTLYALLSSGFFSYAPDTNAWTPTSKALPPGFPAGSGVGGGTSLICPGSGARIYCLLGQNKTSFAVYDTATGGWTAMPAMLEAVVGGGTMAAGPVDPATGAFEIFAVPGYTSTTMYRYAGNAWSPVAGIPSYPGSGMSMACPPGGPLLYILRGMSGGVGTTDLWRYVPGAPRVLGAMPPMPGLADSGACLAGVGDGERLFAFRGAGSADFYRYAISTRTWTPMAPAPAPVAEGGSLAWDGGEILYATRGGGTTGFWRTIVGSESWDDLSIVAPLPLAMGDGGGLVCAGGFVFAMRGFAPDPDYYGIAAPSTQVYKYTPGSGWTSMPGPDGSVFSIGSALAFEPGAGIRAITFDAAGGAAQLRTCDPVLGTWSAPVAFPAGVLPGHGASLCAPGPGRPLVVMPGGGSTKAWTCTEAGGWVSMPDLPGTVGGASTGPASGGGSIVHPGRGPYFYALQGGYSDVFWRYETPNTAPAAPVELLQVRADGVTPIPTGGSINANSFVASARVGDPDDETVVLCIEARPAGEAFTGTATALSAPVYGGRASVAVTLPGPGAYHWQAWTRDDRGLSSGPSGTGADPDLVYHLNHAPTGSAFLMRAAATREIVAAGARIAGDGMSFEIVVGDSDGDDVRLQVEAILAAGAFTGIPTATGLARLPGAVAKVTLENQALGSYRARYRVIDALDEAGAWIEAGEYTLFSGGSLGPASCLKAGAGARGGLWGVLAIAGLALFSARSGRSR